MKVRGDAWVRNADADEEFWAEGEVCAVEVETTDADEVRVGVVLTGETIEAAGVYLSREGAAKLSKFLAAAAVDEVGVAK